MNMNENGETRKTSRLSSHDKVVLRAYADKTFEVYSMPADEIHESEKNITYKSTEMMKRG